MATKKQRSRRAKTFRHDYALVMPDEDGNEVEVASTELRAKKDSAAPAKGKSGSKPASRARARKEPQKPTWNRSLKRGLPWGLVAGIAVTLLTHGPIVVGIVYGLAFVPLMYFTEGFVYRMEQRKAGKSQRKKTG
jgi:hypothetical protein